ncbi:ribonuclease R [Candidatus Gracilibacteria bacterium CG2_30_37_12]|nr:MAG: ribonuclease R [Candidatus Gracilibacteria bacterium CG2_30_37_12]
MSASYTGIYSQIQPHFGFVETLEGEVFFIGKRERNGALDGDTVKVQVTKPGVEGKKTEAKVITLIKRTEKVLVGKYIKRQKSTYGFVQVIEGFGGKDIFISDRDALGAKNDEMVTIRVFGDKNKPHGKVLSILGHKDSQGMAEKIVFHENGIVKEFSEQILREAQKLQPSTSSLARVDLRNEWIVTIDGADAKDLDDAIGIKKFPSGNFEIGVHIADVAEYVREGSILDREAYQRGTSIYTPDEVVPMLPEHLSNNLCSLHPGTPKATLSITMELDKTGKVLHSRIDETLIESKQRFTYDEVQIIIDALDKKTDEQAVFEKYPTEVIELIRNGLELKRILDKRRAKEGKIDFDLKEVKIITDEKGKVVDISKRDRSESHKVIEEFMILANEEVSRFFSEKKIPFLYRVHEKPSEEKADELILLLDHYGYNLTREMLSPRSLREIMDTLHNKDYYFVLSKQILQSMSKAIYSEEILGHFGLALHFYSHFTSPIRRYPDLQIHRIIKAYIHKNLDQKEISRFKTLLPKVAKHTSTTERKAENIEYMIRDIKIIDYMQDKIGKIYDGIIASIGDHGIYVELPNGVEGLVYMRDMRATNYFDERAGTLKSLSGGKTFSLGDPIRVRVTQADKTLRRLDFEVVK